MPLRLHDYATSTARMEDYSSPVSRFGPDEPSDGDDMYTPEKKQKPAAKGKKPVADKVMKPTTKAKANTAKTVKAPASNKQGPTIESVVRLDSTPPQVMPDGTVVEATMPSYENRNPVEGSKEKTASQRYQKITQVEHVLLRPDMYIGSIEALQDESMWVYDAESDAVVNKKISYVPGFYKIFDEILVNAADNKIRDDTMDTIKVSIDPSSNEISIMNNGRGIPIEIHEQEGIYIPELIFGHLLTSSNYDDDEKKVTGGRNGYGAKLCNIFSEKFTVETADLSREKKYVQVFSSNMKEKSKPKITSAKKEYTKITFKPDLAKFGMSILDPQIESLLKRRVYDLAGTLKNVKVHLNEERVKVKNFKQYVEMYLNGMRGDADPAIKTNVIHEVVNSRWEVAFAVSDGQFRQVSFVNSIATTQGGNHVDHVANQLVKKLMESVDKKNKGAALKPFQVRAHLWIFVNCLIENPSFDSQTKERMTLPQKEFGSKCDMSDAFISKVVKSGVMDNILSFAQAKAEQQMKKTDGSRRNRINGIPKLEDANNAGTRNGYKCTLILTEGDSAKALAMSGLSVVGRDNFGVFPLRGKLLNVREASLTQTTGNSEIQAIKQILGLKHSKIYADVAELRYGHLMIMTDQDHDGSHIKGLIINFLEVFYSSLLNIDGFLVEFITPIVRCTKGTQDISFFTVPEYEFWKETHNDGKGWKIKYFKGLGTSTSADAKKYFSALDKHLKEFHTLQDGDKALVDLAFSKKKADERKEWLRLFNPGTYIDHSLPKIPIADFINKELILFSMADNVRSIPSAVDGMKPGQRKILYSCFKRKLKNEIKVAQLAGYISEQSAYHHGDTSLWQTMIGMAQSFVGSNNVNLLEPSGQFGTRFQGGKNSASPRYLFTNLKTVTRKLFVEADEALLTYMTDDGQSIEPEWYIPILPMLLVNGAEGIGTGWSTSIPNYNPKDIVTNIRRLMRNEQVEKMTPWFRGFNGTVESAETRIKVTGTVRQIDDLTIEITELPVRFWTSDMKEFLELGVLGNDKTKPYIKVSVFGKCLTATDTLGLLRISY